ncbi:hypothetical protein BDY24DRAFT_433616 [Mrakia frigida]|uniref:uncharacterized protein n=1 Tax=Mrakia frigida TaxID=29902 RepID=UPI003FCC06FD
MATRALDRHLPLLFILLLIVSAVGLGFSADLVHKRREGEFPVVGAEKHRINYSLFCGVFGVTLSLVFLAVSFVSTVFHWLHHSIFVFANFVFWLADAIALHLLYKGVVRCGGIGSGGISTCHKIKTIEIVAWVNVGLSFLVLLAFVTVGRTSHAHNTSRRGGNYAV